MPLPNQHDRDRFQEAERQQAVQSALDKLSDEPEITKDDLKKLALKASKKALKQLIGSLDEIEATPQVKNRAAEAILNIAWGKDKLELRSDTEKDDAISLMEQMIQDSKAGKNVDTPSSD